MNPVPAQLESMLASRSKDLLCAIEFYSPTYVPHVLFGFNPSSAEALFATETAAFNYVTTGHVTVNYVRSVFSMPSLSRNIGKQSNSVTVRISNVPRSDDPTVQPLASFVLNNEIEGMRMVVRLISRAGLTATVGTYSWVLFVGRCQRQDGFDRRDGTITAKQDLGQIEAVIPPRVFQKDCPLRFKGEECLGSEELGDKSATYQAATICNKTFGQCTEYENTEFFQGIRVAQIQGSFIHRPHEGFFAKLIGLLTPGSGKRRIRVGSSLESGTPYGKAIPIVLGRWQMMGIPIQYQDIGNSINFLMAFCRGRISDILNIRCLNPEFTDPMSVTEHYGRYGGETNQAADTVFPTQGFYSRLAYITGFVNGTDIAVEDPAPDISAIVAGISPPEVILESDAVSGEGTTDSVGSYDFGISNSQSDNPVDLSVYVLIDSALLGLSSSFIDQHRTAKTSAYTLGAIKDVTNAERLILPDTENGRAGVDYSRYSTTGLLCGTGSTVPGGPTFAGAAREADYEFYDPDAPPDSVALKTFYRKRFSCNIALTDQKKAVDFLYDTLLPTFRGFLSWNSLGQVGIRSERPSDSSNVNAASIVGATKIQVDDVLPWELQWHESNDPTIGKVLIGVGLNTSEVRAVTGTEFTADGNSITLSVSSTGSVVLTPSGANFSGGSTTVQASADVTVSGSFAEGDEVTITIDGEDCTYILTADDTSRWKVAKALAFAVNAHPVLQKYVIAHNPTFDDEVHLEAKLGKLVLSSALAEAHDVGEETIRVMMSFASSALTYADCARSNILDGSFKYLGSDGQTRYNQFKGTFHDPLRDFAEQHVIINDYDHQDQIQKVQPLEIDLSAVDNYNQASRLLNGAAAKFGDGIDFFGWASNGLALQLEEGDVVCISHYAGEFRNQAVRIESLTLNDKFEISFKARVYSSSMFNDEVLQTDVPLVSGLTNFAAAPPAIAFNTTDFPPSGLEQSTDGTAGITSIRGGAVFGDSVYAQYATVRLIKRAGVTVNEQVSVITPDSNSEAVFEFIASADGLYTVELEVCNQWGCNTTKPTADIIIGFGSLFGLAMEDGFLLLTEDSDIIEVEH